MTTWIYIKKIAWNMDSNYLEFHIATEKGYDIEHVFKVKQNDKIEKITVGQFTEWEIELKKIFKCNVCLRVNYNYITSLCYDIIRELWNKVLTYDVKKPIQNSISIYNKATEEYFKENLDKSKIIKLDADYCPTCGQELPKEKPKKSIPYKFSDSKVIDYNRFTGYWDVDYYMYANYSNHISVWDSAITHNVFRITFDPDKAFIWTTEPSYVNIDDVPYQYKIQTALLLNFISDFNKFNNKSNKPSHIEIRDVFNNPRMVYLDYTRNNNPKNTKKLKELEEKLISNINKVNSIIKNKEKLPQELENILLCDNFLELVYNNEFDGIDLMNSHTENKKARLYYE